MGSQRQNMLLGILALLLLAWFWSPDLDNPLDQRPPAARDPVVSSYLTDSRSHTHDESGQLVEILAAQRVEHLERENLSEFIQPRYYAHDGHDRSWSLSAHHGTLRHEEEVMALRESIILTNDQSGGTLTTQALDLDLRERIATSQEPVTIRWADNQVTADGMRANLTTEVIRLEPNVESLYVPAGR